VANQQPIEGYGEHEDNLTHFQISSLKRREFRFKLWPPWKT